MSERDSPIERQRHPAGHPPAPAARCAHGFPGRRNRSPCRNPARPATHSSPGRRRWRRRWPPRPRPCICTPCACARPRCARSAAARLAGAASPPAQASSASCARRSPVSRNAAGARRRSAGAAARRAPDRRRRRPDNAIPGHPAVPPAPRRRASAAPSAAHGGRQDHRVVVAAQPRGQAGAQRRAVALDPAARPPSQLGRLGRDGRMLEFRLAGDGIRRVMRQRVHAQSGHAGAAPVHRQEGLAGPEPLVRPRRQHDAATPRLEPGQRAGRESEPAHVLGMQRHPGLIHMLRQHAGERGARQRVPMVAQPPVVSLSG